MQRLAIISTHPIQYYAPVFKLLHQRKKIDIKVFYTWGDQSANKHDPGFGQEIIWDIPLLEGYPYVWAENTARLPGSHHFKGIITPRLNKQIEEFIPDALLIFGWAYRGHLNVIRYFKTKIPVYFRGDSTLLDQTSSPKQLLRYLTLRYIYAHISHAFYTGTRNKAYFKKFGLKENHLSFAPHAIDNGRFGVNRETDAALLRRQMGIAENDILILFAGKFEQKKAPLALLNAFLMLQQPHTHLLFAGAGELESALKAAAAGQPHIHFMPFQNQSYMPVMYQACDVFCLPSSGPGETWGLAVNEAMASGRAVLVSDKSGCAVDLVKPGKNGFIFESGNDADLLDKLRTITASKVLLKEFGRQSLTIIQDWNFTHIAEAIEHQLIYEKSRPHKA